MACQDHVTCVIGDDGVRVSCGIVEELFDFLHGLFGRFGLLGCDGSKGCKHGWVDSSSVVEESTCYFLDKLFVGWAEW